MRIFSCADVTEERFLKEPAKVHTTPFLLVFKRAVKCGCGNTLLHKVETGSWFALYDNYYCEECKAVDRVCTADY